MSLSSLYLLISPGPFVTQMLAQASRAVTTTDNPQAKKQFAFEVLSIRPHQPGTDPLNTEYLPNGYRASFILKAAILDAYIPGPYKGLSARILDAPDWVAHDWYDMDARVAEDDIPAWQQAKKGVVGYDSELLHSAWQVLLKERFKIALRITPVDVPYLDLTIDKHGARLKDTVPGAVKPIVGKTSSLGEGFFIQDNAKRQFVGVSMDEFSRILMMLNSEYPVQDKTGLQGRYDFTLPWYDRDQFDPRTPLDRMPMTSIGLTLKPGKGPGFIINIDHIEKPDPN